MRVFVCFTPLHVIISERIIKKESIQNFHLVYFADVDNEKHRHYYNRIAKNSVRSIFLPLRKKQFFDLYQLHKAFRFLKRKEGLEYYTGKIKSFHCRFLMLLTSYNKITTFDDGSGNISGAGYFYDKNETSIGKLIFLIFNRKLLYRNILQDIRIHYTIFKFSNVYKNTKFIRLFKKSEDCVAQKNEIIILLTNAFTEDGEMKLKDEKLLYKKIFEKYDITHIIKHPREKYEKLEKGNFEILNDVRISEEIIIELSKNNKVTVIGIYSTVLLNLLSVEGVVLKNYPARLKKMSLELKSMFLEMGINSL